VLLVEGSKQLLFFKKVTKKPLIPMAFERPQYGRSKAGERMKIKPPAQPRHGEPLRSHPSSIPTPTRTQTRSFAVKM
jgi:hypothetical protein